MSKFTVLQSFADLPNLMSEPVRYRKILQQFEGHYSNIKTRAALKIAGHDQRYQRRLITIASFVLLGQGLLATMLTLLMSSLEFSCQGPDDQWIPCTQQVACQSKHRVLNSHVTLISLFGRECSTEFDLSGLISAISVFFSLALILLADQFGRKFSVLANLGLQIVGGLAMLAVKSYWGLFVLSAFVLCTSLAVVIQLFLLLNESIGGQLRIVSVGLGFVTLVVGRCVTILLMYALPDFKLGLVIVLSVVCLAVIGLPFVSKSPFFVKNDASAKHFHSLLQSILETNCPDEALSLKQEYLLNYIFNFHWKEHAKDFDAFFAPKELKEKVSVFQSVVEDDFEVFGSTSFSSYMHSIQSINPESQPLSVKSDGPTDPNLDPDTFQKDAPILPLIEITDKADDVIIELEEQNSQLAPLPESPDKIVLSRDQKRMKKLLDRIEQTQMKRILRRYSVQNRSKIYLQTSYSFIFSATHARKCLNALFLGLSSVLAFWLTSSFRVVIWSESYTLNQFLLSLAEMFCSGLSLLFLMLSSRKPILLASQWVFLHVSALLLLFNWLYGLAPTSLVGFLVLKPLLYVLFLLVKLMALASLISLVLYLCETFPTFLRAFALGLVACLSRLSIWFVVDGPKQPITGSLGDFGLLALVSVIGFTMSFILPDSRTNGMLN